MLAGGAALIAIIVATSRALLGVHWVSDVLGGLAFGWGWFLLVAVVFGGRAQRLGDPVVDAAAPRSSRRSSNATTSESTHELGQRPSPRQAT